MSQTCDLILVFGLLQNVLQVSMEHLVVEDVSVETVPIVIL